MTKPNENAETRRPEIVERVFIKLDTLKEVNGALPTSETTLQYAVRDHWNVEGWVEPEMMSVVFSVDAFQRRRNFQGGALEIGVHHGRFFIALANLVDDDQPLVAVDIFEDQKLNIDKSGSGNRDQFLTNIRKFSNKAAESVSLVAADSLGLNVGPSSPLAPGKFRFVSIDGGHTATHTFNDLLLAEKLISDGGVVFLDDILHMHWLGVMEGFMRYRQCSPGILTPFLVTGSKLMLCSLSHHFAYAEFFSKHFPMGKKKTYKWMGEYLVAGNAPVLKDDREHPLP